MDLNLLYSRHQISLICAANAPDLELRLRHERDAHGIAGEIAQFQNAIGASAASGWRLAL